MACDEELPSIYCRTCLSTAKPLHTFEKALLQVVQECTKILIDESLSPMICSNCERVICEFNDFRSRCLEVEDILKAQQSRIHVKCEKIDVKHEEIEVKEELPNTIDECDRDHEPAPNDPDLNLQLGLNKEEPCVQQVELENAKTKRLMKKRPPKVVVGKKKRFTCPECSQQIDSHSELERHWSVAHKALDYPYTCKSCAKRYCDRHSLTIHEQKKHPHSGVIDPDPTLDITYNTKSDVNVSKPIKNQSHKNQEHQNPSKTPMKCDACHVLFSGHCSLLRHWLVAHSSVPVPYNCHECGKPFCREQVLINHVKLLHKDNNGVDCAKRKISQATTCPICQQHFNHKRNLPRHVKRMHTNASIECDECDEMFTNKKLLKNHMQTHNSPVTPALCVFCGLKFVHIEAHTARCRQRQGDATTQTTTFKCRFCKRTFAEMTDLRKHHSDEHRVDALRQVMKYACAECGKKFASSSNLNTHVMYMHKDAKPYQCSICTKAFKQSGKLKRHLLYHRDERPFKCEFCESRFRERTKMINHTRLHTGEKPFKCRFCASTFIRNEMLKRHVRREHEGVKLGNIPGADM